MKNINKQQSSAFEELTQQIIDVLYNGELQDIVQVTYGYKEVDNKYFNVNLISKFGGFDIDELVSDLGYNKTQNKHTSSFSQQDNLPNSEKIWNNVRTSIDDKMNQVIRKIDWFYEDLQHVDIENGNEQQKKKILQESLMYIKNAVEMSLIGLPFELEKAWYEHKFLPQEVQERIFQLEELDKRNFWNKMIDVPLEVATVSNILRSKFIQGKKKLFIEEQKRFESYLQKLTPHLPKDYSFSEVAPKQSNIPEYLSKKIPREDYMKIFDIVFEIYGLPQRTVMGDVGSIYDREDNLYIPKEKWYAEGSIISVLSLISHEIEGHYINLHNNRELIWNIRGAHELEKEEGLAMLLEKSLYENTCKFESTFGIGDVRVIMAEVLSGEELEDFVTLFFKLTGRKTSSKNSALRAKRNYPWGYAGGQHKDVSYGRGQRQLLEYIDSGKPLKDLFVGKVSFDDISVLSEIQEKDKTQGIIYPLLISDVILYYFICKKSGKVFENTGFLSYIKEKYHSLNLEEEFDFEQVPFATKKKIKKILDILEKDIKNEEG